ncbi:MAG: hypothetical protein LBT44_04270 [Clostridiales bacterium]|jgi:uncharacterized protein with FMN-binding domain|nr:hypothetical protein [Clostridiales bacterium]
MGGTKIVVLQLKDVIKTIVFAILGLAVLLLLIYLFVPRTEPEPASSALYVPGVYTSQITLHNSPVDVSVVVSEEKILAVTMSSLAEAEEVFYPLVKPVMETLSKEIVEYQTTRLTPSADYPITGQILLDAVQIALNKAKAESAYQITNASTW